MKDSIPRANVAHDTRGGSDNKNAVYCSNSPYFDHGHQCCAIVRYRNVM